MPSKIRTSDVAAGAWFGTIAALSVADAYLHRKYPGHGFTLSECARTYVHVEHPVGEAVFIAGWATLTAWLVPHIVLPGRTARREGLVLSRLK